METADVSMKIEHWCEKQKNYFVEDGSSMYEYDNLE